MFPPRPGGGPGAVRAARGGRAGQGRRDFFLLSRAGGLCRRVQTSLRLPCLLADNPGDCVVRGTGMALENMELYGDLVYDYHKPVRYDFRR